MTEPPATTGAGGSLKGDGPFVLYLIDSLAPGGAERSLVDVAPYLVAAGIHLEVAVLHDRPGLAPELRGHGIEVHVIGGTSRGRWMVGVVGLLRRRRPDLVHTTLFESDIIGRTAAAVLGIPVVSTLASVPYGPEHRAERGVGGVRLRSAQVADAITARAVRRFHAVSQSTSDACVARMRLRPERVDVIPRGRDLVRMGEPSADRRRAVRQRLELGPDAPVVLAVARQEPPKGLDVLLRAAPQLVQSEPRAVILIAGSEGRATAELVRLATEVGGQAARFLGRRDDIADLLCAADLFVLPSRREGLPGAVLEAMAMGIPVVASDLPAVREAVPGEKYAFLVPPDDPAALGRALADALSDRVGAEARAAAARARFDQHFDIGAVSTAMVDFYRKALAPRLAGSAP